MFQTTCLKTRGRLKTAKEETWATPYVLKI